VDDDPEPRHAAMRAHYAQTANLQARQSIFAYSSLRDGEATIPELIRCPPGQALLDVGCGNGLWLDIARRESKPGLAVGVDLSFGMVQVVRTRLPDAPTAQGDAMALPFRDDAFDTIFALWMLYHVPTKASALAEIRRVLRPGGRLIAATNATVIDDALDQLVRGALEATIATPVDRWIEKLDFDADNGREILSAEFGHIDRRLVHRDFSVPEAPPLVAFVDSLRTPIEAELGPLPWSRVLAELEARIEQRLRAGPITYRSVQCVFVCE
jgi:ubiquinone/menaquinone biosynthesis C-methylase UbiE